MTCTAALLTKIVSRKNNSVADRMSTDIQSATEYKRKICKVQLEFYIK